MMRKCASDAEWPGSPAKVSWTVVGRLIYWVGPGSQVSCDGRKLMSSRGVFLAARAVSCVTRAEVWIRVLIQSLQNMMRKCASDAELPGSLAKVYCTREIQLRPEFGTAPCNAFRTTKTLLLLRGLLLKGARDPRNLWLRLVLQIRAI